VNRYDVFVSYSHRDRTWVTEELLPRLEQAGLKVMYDDWFTAGVPSAVNMADAVRESRRTLIVLTPSWIKSPWTGWEGLLAATAQPGTLIPLLLKPCKRPDWISHLTHIDISGPEGPGAGMAKLVSQLSAPSAPAGPVQGEPVRRGLEALSELLLEEEVRRAVVAFPIHFREAGRQIQILNGYKGLHDLLHRLQQDCYEPISSEADRFPADAEAGENLQVHAHRLQGFLEELRGLPGKFLGDEPARIGQEIATALETFQQALAASDAQRLKHAVWLLNRTLTLKPSMVNMRLNDAARALNLEELAAAMKTVCRKLRDLGLRPELVEQLAGGVTALERLAGSLTGLVGDHDRWQWAEQELRRIEGDLARSLEELESSWPYLKLQIEPLYASHSEGWAMVLKANGTRLDNTLASHDPVKIREHFKMYRREAGNRFFKVDDTLKQQCHELLQAGEPLDTVLRSLE
jgi:hypothetical protein